MCPVTYASTCFEISELKIFYFFFHVEQAWFSRISSTSWNIWIHSHQAFFRIPRLSISSSCNFVSGFCWCWKLICLFIIPNWIDKWCSCMTDQNLVHTRWSSQTIMTPSHISCCLFSYLTPRNQRPWQNDTLPTVYWHSAESRNIVPTQPSVYRKRTAVEALCTRQRTEKIWW